MSFHYYKMMQVGYICLNYFLYYHDYGNLQYYYQEVASLRCILVKVIYFDTFWGLDHNRRLISLSAPYKMKTIFDSIAVQ